MKKKLGIIALLVMMVFVGFGIIIPVLPVIVGDVGNGSLHLGLMLSLYSAASFLMSPYWGALSDRVGRKPVIMTGLIGFSFSFFLFGMAGHSLVLMYLSRIIGGLFSGAVTSCAVAYVADITTDEARTRGMGLIGMSIGIGFLIGPALGGVLSLLGNEIPFFVSSGITLLLSLFAYVFLAESLTPHRERQVQKRPSRWTAFSGAIKYLYVLSFFVSFTLAGLEATFQYFEMAKIGATPLQVSLMLFASGVVGAAIQGGYVRRRVKKGDEPKTIGLGLVLSAVGFALILLSSNVLTAAIFMSVFGAGNSLIRPCVMSLITQKTTVGQGIATGLNSSMDSLGRIAGPLLFGSVLYVIDKSIPFTAGAILCIAALYLLGRYAAADKELNAAVDSPSTT